jgi:hypothetical protein
LGFFITLSCQIAPKTFTSVSQGVAPGPSTGFPKIYGDGRLMSFFR